MVLVERMTPLNDGFLSLARIISKHVYSALVDSLFHCCFLFVFLFSFLGVVQFTILLYEIKCLAFQMMVNASVIILLSMVRST